MTPLLVELRPVIADYSWTDLLILCKSLTVLGLRDEHRIEDF